LKVQVLPGVLSHSPTTKPLFNKPFWHFFESLGAIKKAQILAYFRIRNRIPNRIPILKGEKDEI